MHLLLKNTGVEFLSNILEVDGLSKKICIEKGPGIADNINDAIKFSITAKKQKCRQLQ